MSAFLLLPKYEKAMERIAELQAECEALREYKVWAGNEIHNRRTGSAMSVAQVIGVADRCDYALQVMTIHPTPDGLVIRVMLPKVAK